MRREQKLALILLCRFLERQVGEHHGRHYSKNAGVGYWDIYKGCLRCAYLLNSEYRWLRDGYIFYYQGWGWRVRKNWQQKVKQIVTTNSKIYENTR